MCMWFTVINWGMAMYVAQKLHRNQRELPLYGAIPQPITVHTKQHKLSLK